ncbi:SRPBCC domain-containing protein [Kribbella sp. NBC_00889]|uniref:SRPBCC family protein n=1 Tax=Kribbella sp. NBC_00889 TaxID=2975974 RepID=UPI003862E04B|nr:SRPBCC domain-containing protein [Kribbella sp. NBC_00889]
MVDILHRIAVEGIAPQTVFDAVATRAGIASWWIGDTSGDDAVGGTLDFGAGIKSTVVERRPERVSWQVTEGFEEWIGTRITFDIRRDDDWTVVLFKHEGWAEPAEFMHHCSTKWGVFMVSLKQYLETGTGSPTPHDTLIDNWS